MRINYSPFFSLYVLEEKKQLLNKPSRFGFVVSTKVSKRAVPRNRIKRILRDEVEKVLAKIRRGTSAAFWVRKAALDADSQTVRKSVQKALQDSSLLEK